MEDALFYEFVNKFQIGRGIHLSASLFGAFFLILVWHHTKKDIYKLKQDFGLVLLALGLITWVFMDYQKIVFNEQLELLEGQLSKDEINLKRSQVELMMKQISAFNNAFFLAALPFFKHGFTALGNKLPVFKNSAKWFVWIIVINVFIVLLYSSNWTFSPDANNDFVKHFDVFYSMIAMGSLGYAITKAFIGRKQYGKAFSAVSILITIFLISTQLLFSPFVEELVKDQFDVPALLMWSSHVALITLMLILAQSWVVEERLEFQIKENDIIERKFNGWKKSIEEDIKSKELKIVQLEKVIEDKDREIIQLQAKVKFEEDQPETRNITLSKRELDVMRKVQKSIPEIADDLSIKVETVRTHLKSIKSKIGVSHKDELVEYAIKKGILDYS